jgi:hypothetical protein
MITKNEHIEPYVEQNPSTNAYNPKIIGKLEPPYIVENDTHVNMTCFSEKCFIPLRELQQVLTYAKKGKSFGQGRVFLVSKSGVIERGFFRGDLKKIDGSIYSIATAQIESRGLFGIFGGCTTSKHKKSNKKRNKKRNNKSNKKKQSVKKHINANKT